MTLLISKKIKSFKRDVKGVTMLEYGIIAALIAAVCIGAIQTLGTDINAKFTSIATTLTK